MTWWQTVQTQILIVVVAVVVLWWPPHPGEFMWYWVWELPAGWVPPAFPQTDPATLALVRVHYEHGAGSLTDLRGAEFDTARGRTPSEAADLDGAWDAAHEEHEVWLQRAYFHDLDRALDKALTGFRDRTVRADNWAYYLHTGDNHCPHCTAAIVEQTAEYREIVARVEDTPTGEYAVLPDRHPVLIGGASCAGEG